MFTEAFIGLAIWFLGAIGLEPLSTQQTNRPNQATPDIVIIGELNGTREAPEFVESLVSRALDDGRSVSVVLEQSSSLNEAFESLNGSSDDRHSVCEAGGAYFEESRDGRATVATGDLTLSIGRMIGQGRSVAVRAMDIGPDTPQDPDTAFTTWRRDTMAAAIAEEARKFDITFVLVGNAHPPALKRRLDSSREGFEVISLRLTFDAGQAWNCQGFRCDAHAHSASVLGPATRDGVRRVEFVDGMRRQYDGIAYVGQISASLPIEVARWCRN